MSRIFIKLINENFPSRPYVKEINYDLFTADKVLEWTLSYLILKDTKYE